MAFELARIPDTVRGVKNGEEAIRYLRGEGPYADRATHPLPELVLLDLRLPGMHGFEVLRWIRQQPKLAKLPVVVVTGMETASDARRAQELGASAFMTKPFLFPRTVEMARQLQANWLGSNSTADVREEARHAD